MHSWSLGVSLAHIAHEGCGVAVLLNCGEDAQQLLAQFGSTARAAQRLCVAHGFTRTYGVGAQILRSAACSA